MSIFPLVGFSMTAPYIKKVYLDTHTAERTNHQSSRIKMIAEEQEEVTQDEELLDEGDGEEEEEAEEFIQNSYESNYMKLPLHHRVNNILNTVGYTLKFHTCHTLPRIFYPSKYVCRPLTTKEWKWNPENQGLYVIIHGLLGTPRTTPYSIANAIDAKSPNRFEIKLPRVPYRGNRDLAVCSEPILDMVKSYIAENPNKPIHLIGTSNGARIVSYIETRLRDQPVTIRVTSIAGAYYGSRILNQLNKYAGPVTGLILSRDLRKNLSVGSDECKDLILEMQKPVNIGTRIYEFYGTANDWYIRTLILASQS